jgi:hypothetical protein
MAKSIYKNRVDANQPSLVKEIRAMGKEHVSVSMTHNVGQGFPDIIVGYKEKNYLFEIKDPAKPPSKKRLTKDEQTNKYFLILGKARFIK